jgi:hypothetical protein
MCITAIMANNIVVAGILNDFIPPQVAHAHSKNMENESMQRLAQGYRQMGSCRDQPSSQYVGDQWHRQDF